MFCLKVRAGVFKTYYMPFLPEDIIAMFLQPILIHSVVGENADGAMPIGTVVRKCNSTPENEVRDGEIGSVIGSRPGNERIIVGKRRVYIIYAVEWRNDKGTSLVADFRLERVGDPSDQYEF